MRKTLSLKKTLLYVLLPFLIGIVFRTALISAEEQKIVLYRTFEPSYIIEIAQK